jgi:hypothetical protein
VEATSGRYFLGGIRFAGSTASAGFEIKYQEGDWRSGRQFRGAKDRSGWVDVQLHSGHSVLKM